MIDDVCLIIPVYNPDEELFIKFLEQAIHKFSNIIVVNDGSKQECDSIFKRIESHYNQVKMLKHSVNLGKGRALKTAFNCYLNEYPNCVGIVQADCDGQHDIEDVVNCAKALKENQEKLVIGVRDFSSKEVPSRSRFGNNITRVVFKLFIGISIKDTQTGLRAIGNDLLRKFLSTNGERYEYETNMLIECKEKNVAIQEVPIKTIYIDKNQTSKFNPVKDSLAIYKLFGKYIFSSISAFAIDIILFNIFVKLINQSNVDSNIIEGRILYATIIARIISSLYNFKLNSKMVFKNLSKAAFIKYVILVIIQMFVSAIVVNFLSSCWNINVTAIKIMVDVVIFMVNFVVQREIVFK